MTEDKRMNPIAKAACFLVAVLICGYAARQAWISAIVTPYQRTADYNHGKVYDPYEFAATAPMRNGEGFVCAGTVLGMFAEAPFREDITLKHWERVKIVGNTVRPEGEKLQIVLGYGPKADASDVARYWIPKGNFRKSLSCPDGQ